MKIVCRPLCMLNRCFVKISMEELNGSELGTKEYWEQCYVRDVNNYKRHGEVGEIWFDEDSQFRVINWIMKKDEVATTAKIVDLGCGNGMFLVEMAREGYTNLIGIDYAPQAIELATSIAQDNNLNIKYCVADLMDAKACYEQLGIFDVIHDKGTYDAISLCPDSPKEKRELYINTVASLMHNQTLFIITSCNWTEEELIVCFAEKFIKKATIPTPQFKFGGKVGNVVTSMVFQLKQ